MTRAGEVLPGFAGGTINLASAGLGARALSATDEFFGPLERMLKDEPAAFHPGLYDDHGKWMDGWETRRRRGAGHDYAVIALAAKGRIAGFDVDTSHFTGNYPSACSIEACHSAEDPDEATEWVQLLPVTGLGPNAHHFFAAHSDAVYSHIRLRIHPDGGIARLRVYGTPALDLKAMANETIDLASRLLGGRIVAFSNGHYGHERLIAPGRGANMGDGWETRRRREPGYDWIIVKLAARGHVERILVDTAHFKGNYPDACSLQAADLGGMTAECDMLVASSAMFWNELLPHRKLSADSVHEYGSDMLRHADPVTHVRLNIYPDGGVSRLRIYGRVAEATIP